MLIAIALACLTVTRKLERERRLLAKLRQQRGALDSGSVGIALEELSDNERDTAQSLAAVGVLEIRRGRCSIRTVEFGLFRRKRLRLIVVGGFGAFVLACVVAMLILRR